MSVPKFWLEKQKPLNATIVFFKITQFFVLSALKLANTKATFIKLFRFMEDAVTVGMRKNGIPKDFVSTIIQATLCKR